MEAERTLYIFTDEDLNRFRTKRCVKHEMGGRCPNGNECFDIHCDRNDWNDECFIRPNNSRRPPFMSIERRELRYLNLLCNKINVNAKAKSIDSSNCKNGHDCPYCHTWEEYLYHPMNYKGMMCPSRNSGHKCTNPFCSSFHSADDISKRPKQRWLLRVRKDVKLTEAPQNVEIIRIAAAKKVRPNLIDGILYNRKHKPNDNKARRSSLPDHCVGNGFIDYDYTQTFVGCSNEECDDLKMNYRAPDCISEASTRIAYPHLEAAERRSIMNDYAACTKQTESNYLKSPVKNGHLGMILSPGSATTIAKSPSCSSLSSI